MIRTRAAGAGPLPASSCAAARGSASLPRLRAPVPGAASTADAATAGALSAPAWYTARRWSSYPRPAIAHLPVEIHCGDMTGVHGSHRTPDACRRMRTRWLSEPAGKWEHSTMCVTIDGSARNGNASAPAAPLLNTTTRGMPRSSATSRSRPTRALLAAASAPSARIATASRGEGSPSPAGSGRGVVGRMRSNSSHTLAVSRAVGLPPPSLCPMRPCIHYPQNNEKRDERDFHQKAKARTFSRGTAGRVSFELRPLRVRSDGGPGRWRRSSRLCSARGWWAG